MTGLTTRLAQELGPEVILSGKDAEPFALLGAAPVCAPSDAAGIDLCLRLATEHGACIVPAGHGARLAFGNLPSRCDLVLTTLRLTQVKAHEAADMTLVVEAGASLADVDRYLAAFGQRLAADPPLPERTTIGGLIATDACGPLRRSDGKVRDQLIGIRASLVDGTTIRGGGRVVKNVAGYDLMKLMIGSFGSLAVITEACFKVRPRPAQRRIGLSPRADVGAALQTAEQIRRLAVEPTLLRVVDRQTARHFGLQDATLAIGFAGDEVELEAQSRAVEAAGILPRWHDGDAAAAIEEELRHLQRPPANSGEPLLARLSLPPQHLAVALAKIERLAGEPTQLVADLDSGAAFVCRDVANDDLNTALAWAASVRAAATGGGGHAVFEGLPMRLRPSLDPWGDVAAIGLMRRIKDSLDPQRRLSPGRFVGGM